MNFDTSKMERLSRPRRKATKYNEVRKGTVEINPAKKLKNFEKAILYLEKAGWKITDGRSSSITMEHPDAVVGGKNRFYFIGKNGAVRKGSCKTKSMSVTDWFEKNVYSTDEQQDLKNLNTLTNSKLTMKEYQEMGFAGERQKLNKMLGRGRS